MGTVILLVTALSWTAQQPPDSTYLRLVADLPVAATFSYDILGTTERINVYTQLRDVEVERCALSFEIRTEQISQGARTRFAPRLWSSAVLIPLNAIDTSALSVRAAHPPRNGRYDPQPWSLRIAMKRDGDARIMSGRTMGSRKTQSRQIDLSIRDYETALRVTEWLRDAANRCETWSTAPLEPIR
jgi:hypothetical protein